MRPTCVVLLKELLCCPSYQGVMGMTMWKHVCIYRYIYSTSHLFGYFATCIHVYLEICSAIWLGMQFLRLAIPSRNASFSSEKKQQVGPSIPPSSSSWRRSAGGINFQSYDSQHVMHCNSQPCQSKKWWFIKYVYLGPHIDQQEGRKRIMWIQIQMILFSKF